MYILGIGGYSHDSAACLLKDGRIVAAAMEERFTRKKHDGGIPHKAIAYCLKTAGITTEDLDYIGTYMQPRQRLLKRLPYRIGQVFRSPRYSAAYFLYEIYHNLNYVLGTMSIKGKAKKPKVKFLEHHIMHSASSFFLSPFEEAALLSIDYIGEWAATVWGKGKDNKIYKFRAMNYPQSLGVLYSALTDYLGFMRANDEYKVMGLASYGDPERYLSAFQDIVYLTDDGGYRINLEYFQYHYLPGSRLGYVSPKFIKVFGPPRQKGAPIEDRHKDIAAALQAVLEETVLHLCRYLYEAVGKIPNLCLSGGVALNSKMNGRLLSDSPFSNIYIQPAAGDDGIAIGTAYYIYHQMLGNPRCYVMDRADWGPEFSDEAIEQILRMAKIPYEDLGENICSRTAELIAQGDIIGWFQGRMEFGPRALGHRSIIADPTREEMKDILNLYVKHREDFRPFAPSVCEENFYDFFVRQGEKTILDHNTTYPPPSPFMLYIFDVKEEMKSKIPAVTHIDGTARVQTVNQTIEPLYYSLIKEFEKIKGVPVIINTSFNIRGEPIVCTPQDALRCFFSTGMDSLIMGRFLIKKNK